MVIFILMLLWDKDYIEETLFVQDATVTATANFTKENRINGIWMALHKSVWKWDTGIYIALCQFQYYSILIFYPQQ